MKRPTYYWDVTLYGFKTGITVYADTYYLALLCLYRCDVNDLEYDVVMIYR